MAEQEVAVLQQHVATVMDADIVLAGVGAAEMDIAYYLEADEDSLQQV